MATPQLPKHTTVGFKQNFLTIGGHKLRANVLNDTQRNKLTVSAELLTRVLLLGRTAIAGHIEMIYHETRAKNPGSEVVRPSIFAVQLGTTVQTDLPSTAVFTEQGHANGGVLDSITEIQPRFYDYWYAVAIAGLTPEVRRVSGKQDGGSWLLVRDPELEEPPIPFA